ncbi:unnamed protein product [Didymodactylos carnosus]|uniref:Uncharacterized protein n=1 Tax=Didymodactylos carnosus TaxID=1234261 RepID=A0A814JMF9_9BILA|nr:unnamed protein product [Didymodactylos carnosus]CAF1040393.1 unnamed protein product [Didymodactylos carnosus]CAF3498190.1 unnamed protein product [Didymodactylos carnosus]CAF3810702.1 unnamed protein product [Didymodactylos carnosus]
MYMSDLDFELVDDSAGEMSIRELLQSSSFRFTSSGAIIDPLLTGNNKRSSPRQDEQQRVQQVRTQLMKQYEDEKRTSSNSTGTSSSPLSYSSRLSSSTESSPIRPPLLRNQNSTPTATVLPSSTSSTSIQQSPPTKQLDSVSLLLKQTIVPSQTYQIQTRLENPTQYHLEQMCRKQLTNGNESLPLQQQPPQRQLSSINQILQDVSSPESERNSEMDDQLNDDTTCGSVESTTPSIDITPRLSTTLVDDHVSNYLSSPASKEDITRHSSSCPTNMLRAKAQIGLPLTDEEMRLVIRDRQKKDNHNMKQDIKQNKGTILRASVDYIKILRREYENARLIEEKYRMLSEQNKSLQDRVQDLEQACLVNGFNISPSNSKSINNNSNIKQEPSSLPSSVGVLSSSYNQLLAPPSTPILLDYQHHLDNISFCGNADDSNEDPLPIDPLLSSTSSFNYGENDMDTGMGF